MALELERLQPEQQLKPAMNPLLQGIYNLLGGGLEGALPNDPVIENLVQAGGVVKDIVNDPFTYLGGGTVAGTKAALTPFLIARRKEIQQTLKTFDEDPILRGNETVRNSLKKELDQINKTEAEDLRIKEQYEGFVKDPTTFGKKQPIKELADATKKTGRKPMSVDEIATQIRRNEEAGTPFVFRGERGIASLPNKPKYLAADALDTRLPNFSKEGFEIYKPQFNKVLDVDNMPSRIDEILTNIEMRGGRPSRTGGANQRDFDIERIRGNDSFNITKMTPLNKILIYFWYKNLIVHN